MSDVRLSGPQFVGAELRRARSAAKLSREELAHAINYSPSLVSMVESA